MYSLDGSKPDPALVHPVSSQVASAQESVQEEEAEPKHPYGKKLVRFQGRLWLSLVVRQE
jgi:hypothetical protein